MDDPRFVQTDPCRTCGPAGGLVPVARTGEPNLPGALPPIRTRADLDEVGEDETWLWRLVDEADRVFAAAPPAADPQRLADAQRTLGMATAFEERIQMQIRAAQTALSSPLSWLRPSHRAALLRQLKRDKATAVIAAVQRRRAAEVRDRLRAAATRREDYLAEHRVTLAAGRNARSELVKVIDDLIEGYARLTDQPAWFQFGIGAPAATPNWLDAARKAVAARRRDRLDDGIPQELC